VRRITAGFIAFLAATGVLVVLPVYAAPVPETEPVEASIDEVDLGSVVEPEGDAVVVTDGDVQPDGVDPEVVGGSSSVPSTVPTIPGPASETPAGQTPAPSEEPSDDASDDDVVSSGEELPGVPALTVSQPDVDRFFSVGITWQEDPSVTDVVAQVRVKDGDGNWGEWTQLEADDIEQTVTDATEANDVRGGTAPYWTGEAYGLEATVQGADGTVPEDVTVALIDPGSSPADDLPTTPAVQDQAHAAATMPAIITRAQWGADESIRTWKPEYAATIKAATVHHTADGNNYTAAQVPGIMRSIYAYHTQTREWGDIGYNVIVDKFGRIFEGRYGGLTSTVIGAHAGGFNTGTFGVSMLGNYTLVDTPQVMLDSVAAVIAWKLSLYGVNPRGTTQLTSGGGGTSRYAAGVTVTVPTVFAHRDVGLTECPGNYAYSRMPQIRSMVTSRMTPVAGSPVGSLDVLKLAGPGVALSGWTFDPDMPTVTVGVDVTVDGKRAVRLLANRARNDVAAAHPQAGKLHGFSGSAPLTAGEHTVCVTFVNGGRGASSTVRCQLFTMPANAQELNNPIGDLETVTLSGRTITATGWTIDPDAQTTPSVVHVYLNGTVATGIIANQARADIAATYPAAGKLHGYRWSMEVTGPGPQEVCTFTINRNGGTTNPRLGCRTVTVEASAWNPVGALNGAQVSGRDVTVTGWAVDMDTPTSPLTVHLYVDGRFSGAFVAQSRRADVARAFPATGDRHGLWGTLQVAPGRHSVCAYAINTGQGAQNPGLGCRTVTVQAAAWNPIGRFDGMSVTGRVVTIAGYAIEPDQPTSPSRVHVYVDGRATTALTAGSTRADVGRAFPWAGPLHGFSTRLTLAPGRHTICVYGINAGNGAGNPSLGCKAVTV
jgi:hypothetical protein